MSNTIISTIASILSLFNPPQSGDTVRVTVNTHNNVGHTAQQTSNQPPVEKPTTAVAPLSKQPIFFGIAAIGSYAGLRYYLGYLTSYLTEYTRWSLWRSDISLEKLKTTDNVQLQTTIKDAIVDHYGPSYFLATSLFLKDIEQEQSAIKQLQMLTNILRKTYLVYIIPLNERLIKQLPIRTARLKALKKIMNLDTELNANSHLPEEPFEEIISGAKDVAKDAQP